MTVAVESRCAAGPAAVGATARMRAPDRGGEVERTLAVEAPVSLEFNGLAYAVMMASPSDLEDFALGFAITEGLVAGPDEIVGLDVVEGELGWFVRMMVAPERLAAVHERVRRRVSDGGCGLCGIDNLQHALRSAPPVRAPPDIGPAAVFRALDALRERQALNGATGAAHAAAMCAPDGAILAVREDVGRHNAFDKLIGALARAGADRAAGFALLSSRCSFELVDKALWGGFTALVTISAPTSLAVTRAKAGGLTLVALARADNVLVFHDPGGRFA